MILDNISSTHLKISPTFMLGSSSTDGEDREFLSFIQYPVRGLLYEGTFPWLETTSHPATVSILFTNETYRSAEVIPEEMLEHDIFVKMPPKRRRTVKFKIRRIRKAKPRIFIPEYPYIDTI
ncbi:MAG: hypothetical protein C4538_01550 [Nitrospiraceae bacterium]|nr:MAG: hypothetical protein C4538_01550 [Nitrospiraceae bacterium]